MRKIIFSIITFLLLFLFWNNAVIDSTFATSAIPLDSIQDFDKKLWNATTIDWKALQWTSTVDTINKAWFSLLTRIKTILAWLMVIYIVYTGAQMIMSMWTDEEQLSSSKRQLWYTVIAFVFINIPGSLYQAFDSKWWSVWNTTYSSWFKTPWNETNLFMDAFSLWRTLNTDIIGFIEIMISFIAIVIIIIAGINMLVSRWREEKLTEAKNKIIWSVIWLLLVWFLETWKYVVFKWEIDDWADFFETATNLALFFAGPIAIIFLTIAAYTFITSNGDEEKVKKAKSIVVNVLIATVILLASYTFLLDLVTL